MHIPDGLLDPATAAVTTIAGVGAVGYALKNSASEAARHRLQTPAVTRPQMTLVLPPLGKASEREADSAVQEFKMAKARPSMESGEKFRLSSCFTPSAARCSSSRATLARLSAEDIVYC